MAGETGMTDTERLDLLARMLDVTGSLNVKVQSREPDACEVWVGSFGLPSAMVFGDSGTVADALRDYLDTAAADEEIMAALERGRDG